MRDIKKIKIKIKIIIPHLDLYSFKSKKAEN